MFFGKEKCQHSQPLASESRYVCTSTCTVVYGDVVHVRLCVRDRARERERERERGSDRQIEIRQE